MTLYSNAVDVLTTDDGQMVLRFLFNIEGQEPEHQQTVVMPSAALRLLGKEFLRQAAAMERRSTASPEKEKP